MSTPRPRLANTVPHSIRCCCADCVDSRRHGRVVRYETSDDMGTDCSSLCIASCEPPTDPESRIVLRGGLLLAEAHPERTEWVFTTVGLRRIEAEANGVEQVAS